MSDGPTRSEGEPHDYLTTIANRALQAIEGDDVRVIVMVNGDDRAGIAIGGYDDDTDAVVDLFMHLKAIMEAAGKTLDLVGIPDHPPNP